MTSFAFGDCIERLDGVLVCDLSQDYTNEILLFVNLFLILILVITVIVKWDKLKASYKEGYTK